MSEKLTITRPDDWHVHLRDGDMLKAVAPFTARQFGRALIMPNLDPPVRTVEQAMAYRGAILETVPDGTPFDPKMSLFLTDDTSEDEVRAAARCEHVLGFKWYPAGATTNSATGVTRASHIMGTLECMAENGVVLQIHGEVTDSHVDIFDREALFIEQVLVPIHREIPELRLVLEHITTTEGVDFVRDSNRNIAATITPQHLLYSRNEIFKGGIRPHLYCLPVLKRESHRLSVLQAAVSGNPSFFLGTDSAPHPRNHKESACGCAGIFSACTAIEFYAEIFEGMEHLDRLEDFSSHFGADFYGVDRSSQKAVLDKKPQEIPPSIECGHISLTPLMAGESLSWTFAGTR